MDSCQLLGILPKKLGNLMDSATKTGLDAANTAS